MIERNRATELMRRAIEEAKASKPEDQGAHPLVGAVLADSTGKIVATGHRGETAPGRHAEFELLTKVEDADISTAGTELFVTLEPCTARGPGKTPCADRIAEAGIQRIHIGMLDPNPQILGRGETRLRWLEIEVERFPSDLIKKIEELNSEFIQQHREAHLPQSSLYVSTQISDLVLDKLQREGLEISELPYDWDVSIDDVVEFCRQSNVEDIAWDLRKLLHRARGEAFGKKYADYTYETDARGFTDSWKADIREILSRLGANDLEKRRILNVGIGNGLEGMGLLEHVEYFTMVDIAEASLERARRRIPRARTLVGEAEDLSAVRTASQDIYISLRAYQSSYFDMVAAVREAYRVTKQGGLFLVSIANAFMGEGNVPIPGLVIPHTSIVDRDRPFELAERIRRQLSLLRFQDVGVRSGETEIFVFGRRAV